MKHVTKRTALITAASAAAVVVAIGVTAAIVGPAPQTTAASSPDVTSTSTPARTVTRKPQPAPATTRHATYAPAPTATTKPVAVKTTAAPTRTAVKTHKAEVVKAKPTSKAPTCADHVTDLVTLSVTATGEWNAERIGSDAPGAKPPHCISDTVQWFMNTESSGGCAKIGMASKNPKFKPGIGPSTTTAPVINDPLDQFGTC